MKFEKIGNIAEFLNGVAFKPSEWQETGMKIIRIQNLTNPYNQYNRTKRKVDHKYIVNCGDVLVSWSATIGVFIWHDEPALLNQHIFKVNFDNSKVTKEYFILALKDTIRDLSKFAHGSTMKHVVKDDFDNHKIPLPSLNDQRYISNILTKAENLINQRKESICLLDEYLKSTFLEMFGSDLIREKKWKIIQFGEIITDLSDYHANGSYEILREHIVLKNELDYALIVRTTDLENKNFIEGCNYIDEAAYNFLKKSKIYGGEIIINKIGSAGNVYLMPNLNKPVSLGMNAFLLRFKEQANNIFIYYLLTSNFGEKAIQKHVKGAITKTITKDAIRNIKIPFPPTELQNKFAQIVEKTETHKAQYQQSLQELEKLYGSLSQRAFKGELSFKDEKLMMAAEPDTFYPVNTHP